MCIINCQEALKDTPNDKIYLSTRLEKLTGKSGNLKSKHIVTIFKLPTFDIFIAEEFSRFLLIMAVACAFKKSLHCDQQSVKTQSSTSFRAYTVNTA